MFGQSTLIPEPISKEVLSVKKEGRFIATINNAPVTDSIGLMKDYSLQVQWWTLLGEPIEYYTLKWNSTKNYQINNETVTRNQLIKYPDLLKRFDNLQPSKMEIKIEGYADAGRVVVKRGKLPPNFGFETKKGFPFKKNGQAYDEYFLNSEFCYVVEDPKLLYTKAGKLGESIVSGSPHWNEFLHWGEKKYWKKNDKNNTNLQKVNKRKFNKAKKINIQSKVITLEWNQTELRAILDLYKKYESGELEPSPIEEVKERTEKEVKNLKTYTKNDFWSEIEEPAQPKIVVFRNGNKYGLKYKNTSKILVNAKYYSLQSLKNYNGKLWVAEVKDIFELGKGYTVPVLKRNDKILINEKGVQVIPGIYHEFKYMNYISKGKYTEVISAREIYQLEGGCKKRYSSSKEGTQSAKIRFNIYDMNFKKTSTSVSKKGWAFTCY